MSLRLNAVTRWSLALLLLAAPRAAVRAEHNGKTGEPAGYTLLKCNGGIIKPLPEGDAPASTASLKAAAGGRQSGAGEAAGSSVNAGNSPAMPVQATTVYRWHGGIIKRGGANEPSGRPQTAKAQSAPPALPVAAGAGKTSESLAAQAQATAKKPAPALPNAKKNQGEVKGGRKKRPVRIGSGNKAVSGLNGQEKRV